MKKWICLMVVCVLLSCCASAEGLLPGLEDVYGVGMPSLYTLLNRYPDAVEETAAGLEETWENLMDADFSAFGKQLSASGCEMLNYTSDNDVFVAEVGKSDRTYRFTYDATSRRATLVFPVGTYDEALYAVEQDYQGARAAIEAQKYKEAVALLYKIRGYRDVDNILENDDSIADVVAWYAQFEVGNTVTYGSYEQDDDSANGAEDIKWIVLENNGDTCTIISKYALDCKPYHTMKRPVTWEKSTLRKWLNGEFLNTAFTDEEQAKLQTVTVTTDKDPFCSTDPGNDTQDKVYLLSSVEAESYFSTVNSRSRLCTATMYAEARGARNTWTGACDWWLRSPGYSGDTAECIYHEENLRCEPYVNNPQGVRPVVCLQIY